MSGGKINSQINFSPARGMKAQPQSDPGTQGGGLGAASPRATQPEATVSPTLVPRRPRDSHGVSLRTRGAPGAAAGNPGNAPAAGSGARGGGARADQAPARGTHGRPRSTHAAPTGAHGAPTPTGHPRGAHAAPTPTRRPRDTHTHVTPTPTRRPREAGGAAGGARRPLHPARGPETCPMTPRRGDLSFKC